MGEVHPYSAPHVAPAPPPCGGAGGFNGVLGQGGGGEGLLNASEDAAAPAGAESECFSDSAIARARPADQLSGRRGDEAVVSSAVWEGRGHAC